MPRKAGEEYELRQKRSPEQERSPEGERCVWVPPISIRETSGQQGIQHVPTGNTHHHCAHNFAHFRVFQDLPSRYYSRSISSLSKYILFIAKSQSARLVEVQSRWTSSYWFRSQEWVVSDVRELDLDSQPFLEIPQACRILLENSFDNLFDVRSPSVEEGMSLRAVFPRFLFDGVQDLLE